MLSWCFLVENPCSGMSTSTNHIYLIGANRGKLAKTWRIIQQTQRETSYPYRAIRITTIGGMCHYSTPFTPDLRVLKQTCGCLRGTMSSTLATTPPLSRPLVHSKVFMWLPWLNSLTRCKLRPSNKRRLWSLPCLRNFTTKGFTQSVCINKNLLS